MTFSINYDIIILEVRKLIVELENGKKYTNIEEIMLSGHCLVLVFNRNSETGLYDTEWIPYYDLHSIREG